MYSLLPEYTIPLTLKGPITSSPKLQQLHSIFQENHPPGSIKMFLSKPRIVTRWKTHRYTKKQIPGPPLNRKRIRFQIKNKGTDRVPGYNPK